MTIMFITSENKVNVYNYLTGRGFIVSCSHVTRSCHLVTWLSGYPLLEIMNTQRIQFYHNTIWSYISELERQPCSVLYFSCSSVASHLLISKLSHPIRNVDGTSLNTVINGLSPSASPPDYHYNLPSASPRPIISMICACRTPLNCYSLHVFCSLTSLQIEKLDKEKKISSLTMVQVQFSKLW